MKVNLHYFVSADLLLKQQQKKGYYKKIMNSFYEIAWNFSAMYGVFIVTSLLANYAMKIINADSEENLGILTVKRLTLEAIKFIVSLSAFCAVVSLGKYFSEKATSAQPLPQNEDKKSTDLNTD